MVGLYSDVSATVECPGGHHSAETRALSAATDYLEHILRGIERREYDHRRENPGHLRQSVDPQRERRRPTNRYSLSVSLSLSLCVSFSLFLSRSLTGEGNFNWRFLFNFNYLEIEEKIVHEKKDSVFQVGNITKKLSPRIVIRVYDADLLLTDDFLGECVLNMTHLPIGEKSAKKWKAEILRILKHRALNLFVHKRLAGKHSWHSVYSKNERSRIGW